MQTTTTALNIKKGEYYNHAHYGKVKVTTIECNKGDKADRISHIVYFVDRYGISETQGINGFKFDLLTD